MDSEERQYIIILIETEKKKLKIPSCFVFSEEKLADSYPQLIKAIMSIGVPSIMGDFGRDGDKYALLEILKRNLMTLEESK